MTIDDDEGLSLCRQLMEEASKGPIILSEVFLKSARTIRCELGPFAIRSIERRRESGIALRIWDRDGREGSMHSDAAGSRSPADLVLDAVAAARMSGVDLIPRLPPFCNAPVPAEVSADSPLPAAGIDVRSEGPCRQASGQRTLVEISEPETEAEVKELSRRLMGAFSRAGREAVFLKSGWIEAGAARISVVNSLGLSVRTVVPLASAEAEVIGSQAGGSVVHLSNAVGASSRAGPCHGMLGGSHGTPFVRMRSRASFECLAGFDPDRFAEELCWRTAASIGGEPINGRDTPVLLEPRAAATWIRSILPNLQAGSPDRCFGGRQGLQIVDDPAVPFDGEGRAARRRIFVKDGEAAGGLVDSRDPTAPEEDLGPMRRDSYRDRPQPGPLCLRVLPGAQSRGRLLEEAGRVLYVTSLIRRSAPGSGLFAGEARGVLVEAGRAVRPVSETLMVMPAPQDLSRLAAWGSDLELDSSGPLVETPSLLFQGVDLVPL